MFSAPWYRETFMDYVSNLLLVFEMLDGTQTLESPVDHDG